MDTEYVPFPKIYRWSREVIVTEKIDGTNGLIEIGDDGSVRVGSRTRWITPEQDNHGFAAWVKANQEEIVTILGPGRHFGEWWGAGIQRRYGLAEKRFSLFNAVRWEGKLNGKLFHVPILWRGVMDQLNVDAHVIHLASFGSVAAPGFMKPEGIVIHHPQSGFSFKKTLEKDAEHKGNL